MAKSSILYLTALLTLILMLCLFALISLHPMYMILLLIIYTMIICMIMSMWTFNYIYSIITFLMMISGMLIIFLYFSSLISNEQNKPSLSASLIFNLMLNILMIIYLLTPIFTAPVNLINMDMNMDLLPLYMTNLSSFTNVFTIYSHPSNTITILSIFYLLLALLIVIKLSNVKTSSLRKIK
uniref:NADH dehydrogenase subunit 6 n=1 Tax=Stenamma muralla TaxID=1504015 RepID=UPI001FCDE46C|nr:NADH dehydrogenase subunit 6 [Stenamma muralla]UNZ99584.1 NADH dehydrogenase subunit 6 [Stenamma muralla]